MDTGQRRRAAASAVRGLALAIVVAGADGCSIADGYKSVHSDEDRVTAKAAALRQEELQRTALDAEKQRLTRDLSDKRMTLDQLDGRLDQLQRENARSSATTKELQDRRDRLATAIAARRAEIDRLRNRTDLPDAEKLRRIETLKQQIGQQLEFQLH